MGFLKRVVVLAATVFAAALVAQTTGARGPRPYTTWTVYGGAADSSQYSALDQITRSNVSRLQSRGPSPSPIPSSSTRWSSTV